MQLGFAGPPVQVRPCGTVALVFLKATVPPRPTDAVDGLPGIAGCFISRGFDRRTLRRAHRRRAGARHRSRGAAQATRLPRLHSPCGAPIRPRIRDGLPRFNPVSRTATRIPFPYGLEATDLRRRRPDRRRCPGRGPDDDQDRDREPRGDDGADPQGRRRRRRHRPGRGAARRGRRGAEDDRQGIADPGDRRHPLQPHPGAEGDRRRRPLHPPQPRQHRRPRESRRGRRARQRRQRADADRRQLRLAPQTPARARAREPGRGAGRAPRSSSSS